MDFLNSVSGILAGGGILTAGIFIGAGFVLFVFLCLSAIALGAKTKKDTGGRPFEKAGVLTSFVRMEFKPFFELVLWLLLVIIIIVSACIGGAVYKFLPGLLPFPKEKKFIYAVIAALVFFSSFGFFSAILVFWSGLLATFLHIDTNMANQARFLREISRQQRPVQAQPAYSGVIEITAEKLYEAFSKNQPDADARYKDKTIHVIGKVNRVATDEQNNLYIGIEGISKYAAIIAYVKDSGLDATANLAKGQTVVVSGKCSGYNTWVYIIDAVIA